MTGGDAVKGDPLKGHETDRRVAASGESAVCAEGAANAEGAATRSCIRFVRSAALAGDPGPQPLRYASVNGRQFFAMVSPWPELAREDRVTGIYHAAGGREKVQIKAMGRDLVVGHGFDVLKPAAMIFEHVPFGPLAQLAITLGCKGPFWSIEADELAGPTALLQALEDLAEGRCDQAIVAGFDFDPPAARAFLLVRDDAAELAWSALFTHGVGQSGPDRADVEAIGLALGGPVALLGEPATLPGEPVALLGEPVALSGDPATLASNAPAASSADHSARNPGRAGLRAGRAITLSGPAGVPVGASAQAKPATDGRHASTALPEQPCWNQVSPANLHGLPLVVQALESAASGQPTAIWRQVPDGRGMLLGVRTTSC